MGAILLRLLLLLLVVMDLIRTILRSFASPRALIVTTRMMDMGERHVLAYRL
jgi:hypothetical protein